MTLPQAFVERMKKQLGDETEAFLKALSMPYVRGVRLNKLKPVDNIEKLCAIPWAENAYYIDNDSELGKSALHEGGAFYIQEPSAMIPATVLAPNEEDVVLDLCASPGGKSTQLALLMNNKGTLVSNEPIKKRALTLSSNIERIGLTNTIVTNEYPDKLSAVWANTFDKILVDAPCSGEGMFRRHNETILEWSKDNVHECVVRQKAILNSAAIMLKAGGKMVYSTCTFNEDENEHQMADFLSTHKDFSLQPFFVKGIGQSEGMMHIYPHKVKGEGHFVACLVKAGKAECNEKDRPKEQLKKLSASDQALLEKTFHDVIRAPLPYATYFKDKIIAPPSFVPPLSGVHVLRLGLTLGSVRANRLILDHAVPMSLPFIHQVPLDAQMQKMWLHGETLPAPQFPNCFAAPTAQNVQLGYGKVVDEVLKNNYPKGLRK